MKMHCRIGNFNMEKCMCRICICISKICLLVFFILPAFGAFSQLNNPQPSYTRERKISSFREIFDLKQGVLLVMLHTKQSKIDALRSLGRATEADELEFKQAKKNKGIIKAFRMHFDYCPVYFFSNVEADKIIQGKISALSFVNDSLDEDPSIRPNTEKCLFAEFGIIADDNSGSLKNVPVLVLEDKKLHPLKKPFPYYKMIIEDEDRIFDINNIMIQFNESLYEFNKTAKRRILKPKFEKYFEREQ